ncbi:MAG: carboxylating nicotinate-nucleotide diphosphorylase [Gammaproteobacteria bacterium]|nr:carboxylating nicotinate-nucleotide diphosphorylase [Gammaproteobacteria bacterium]
MDKNYLNQLVATALAEDIGSGDLTASLIPKAALAKAKIISKQSFVVCGKDFVTEVFRQLDQMVAIDWKINDGDLTKNNGILCEISGPARSLLTGERTALNFLQTLSSTATLTQQFAKKISGTKTTLLDTRKTIPGLRIAQKYAVTCGGGKNHRFGLYDAILIKENHIAACGSIIAAITEARKLYPDKKIEVEVQNLSELHEAISANPNIIMLDNFDLASIQQAVAINAGKTKLEVSGEVNLDNILAIAKTGVDYISVGAITKTIIKIELSMLFFKHT